jgi:hypothetical protein
MNTISAHFRRRQASLGRESGISIVFLAVVFLGGIVAAAAMLMGSGVPTNLNSSNIAGQVGGQAGLIRDRILQYVNLYGYWPSGATVRTLVEASAPTAYQQLWQSPDGVFLPAPPKGFSEWSFSDDGSTTFIQSTTTTNGDAVNGLQSLLSGASRIRFMQTEAKCVNAGGVLTFILYLRFSSGAPPANSFYPACGSS